MNPTKETYLRAADYMERVGNNNSKESWGRLNSPCCMGGALIFSCGKELYGADLSALRKPLEDYFDQRLQSFHDFSASNTAEVCAGKLREIAQTLPSETRERQTDISILKGIAASVSAGQIVEIVG